MRYRLTLTDGTVEMIDNPSSYPDPSNICLLYTSMWPTSTSVNSAPVAIMRMVSPGFTVPSNTRI